MCLTFMYIIPDIQLMNCDSWPTFDTYGNKGMCLPYNGYRNDLHVYNVYVCVHRAVSADTVIWRDTHNNLVPFTVEAF